MARLFQMLFVCSTLMFLGGCGAKPQEPDIQGIKIGDLAPVGGSSTISPQGHIQPQSALRAGAIRTTNIEATTFELPAENIKYLDGIWQVLNPTGSLELRYSDPNGFAANGLRAASGGLGALDKVTKMLKSAEAKKLSTTALLIPDGQSEVLNIARLTRRTTISYLQRQNVIKNAEVGPGILGFQVTARQIPGARLQMTGGMVNIQVVPVILVSTEGLGPELAARLKANDIRFYSAGFRATMKPGDFVVVTPWEYKPDEVTAASRFFTQTRPKPAVRVLLLVCTSIT
jgi:hypothetical protein